MQQGPPMSQGLPMQGPPMSQGPPMPPMGAYQPQIPPNVSFIHTLVNNKTIFTSFVNATHRLPVVSQLLPYTVDQFRHTQFSDP